MQARVCFTRKYLDRLSRYNVQDKTPESYRIRLSYAAVRAIITPFKVIQGRRVWYQSKAHMRLPISD